MNDFERKIQNMPWREPSDELKDKIFGTVLPDRSADPAVAPPSPGSDRSISIQLGIALATAAAFIGFIAGTSFPTNPPSKTIASVAIESKTDIRIIETSSLRNSFDFSAGATQILPGEFVAYIDSEAEDKR